MALVRVEETETQEESDDNPSIFGARQIKGAEKDVRSADSAFFVWKCSCGNMIRY